MRRLKVFPCFSKNTSDILLNFWRTKVKTRSCRVTRELSNPPQTHTFLLSVASLLVKKSSLCGLAPPQLTELLNRKYIMYVCVCLSVCVCVCVRACVCVPPCMCICCKTIAYTKKPPGAETKDIISACPICCRPCSSSSLCHRWCHHRLCPARSDQ